MDKNKNNPSRPTPRKAVVTMAHLEILKKFNRFNPLESSTGVVTFLFFSVLFLGSFLFLDYRTVTERLSSSGRYWLGFHGSLGLRSTSSRSGWPGFLDEEYECDIFDGNWVWDENYPLYESRDCGFLDEGFRCSENGRPDNFYTKWRWQPRYCNLPRFDAAVMLEKLRNRRVAFVGDSIGRNQWESLLCMLSSVVTNKSSIYEVDGKPITKHTGCLVFRFADFNFTLEYYRSPFLMAQTKAPKETPDEVKVILMLDHVDWTWNQWIDVDVLVLNTGHWWNYEKTIRGGCYFQIGNEVKMNMSIEDAYRRTVRTVLAWIDNHVNLHRTHVYFQSYAPVHFRGGDWKSGGSCHLETLPDLGPLPVSLQMSIHLKVLVDVLLNHSVNAGDKRFSLLNVTGLTARRKDGHSSLYYLGPKAGPAPLHRQDCSHWCLPGVPDTWNELLYAHFLKEESNRTKK